MHQNVLFQGLVVYAHTGIRTASYTPLLGGRGTNVLKESIFLLGTHVVKVRYNVDEYY